MTKKIRGLKSDGELREWYKHEDGSYKGLVFNHYSFNDGVDYVIHKDDIRYVTEFDSGLYICTRLTDRKYWLPFDKRKMD